VALRSGAAVRPGGGLRGKARLPPPAPPVQRGRLPCPGRHDGSLL